MKSELPNYALLNLAENIKFSASIILKVCVPLTICKSRDIVYSVCHRGKDTVHFVISLKNEAINMCVCVYI
jgi:hypothetical protein